MKRKTKIAIAAWILNGYLCFALWQFMVSVYPAQEKEVGYSAEYRARLNELVLNITPLSVAALGE